MAIPNYKKLPKIPVSVSPRIELKAFSSISYGDPSLNVVSGGLPKTYLEFGDIIQFDYSYRSRYNKMLPYQEHQILNPIVICCGFERNRVHGIDLRVMNIMSQGSTLESKFYLNYKMKYYTRGERNDVPLIDRSNFNPSAINSGVYGGREMTLFYRSYNISKMKNRSAIIINIEQAENYSGYGHQFVSLSNYER